MQCNVKIAFEEVFHFFALIIYSLPSTKHSPSKEHSLRLGSFLRLHTPQLHGPVLLDRLLALANGRGAGDSVGAEVGAAGALGGAVGDGAVGLSCGGARAEGCALVCGSRLVGFVCFFGQESDASVFGRLDANGLFQ